MRADAFNLHKSVGVTLFALMLKVLGEPAHARPFEALELAIGGILADAAAKPQLCLLLDRLSVGKKECNLGVQVQVSHPVVADLRVSLTGSQKLLEYRNDTAFGDFRFWLVQSAIERIANEIEWKEPKRK